MVHYITIIVLFAASLGGCSVVRNVRQPEMMSGLALSPDGQTMAFSYQYYGLDKERHTRTIGFYDFASEKFSLFETPKNQGWSKPSYSWDGTKLVFTISQVTEKGLHWDKKKFAIMDLSDFSYEIITPDWGMRFWPTFSPDAKRILYKKPAEIRNRGKTRYKHWDIWEMDIGGEERTQLTFYKYYQLGNCFYLPDGEKIIFSGLYPLSINSEESDAFYNKYWDNMIFIIDRLNVPDALDLEPFIEIESYHKNYKFSKLVGITKHEEILYKAITNGIDKKQGLDPGKKGFNYDLFIKQRDGKNNRLTMMKSYIADAAISLDGSRVIFQDDKDRNRILSYWSINSDGTDLFEIKLPQQQKEWQSLKPKNLQAIDQGIASPERD
ncbi:periplasmic component of the Tol biopolymer transport system [Desulfocapsa sulfexigens DSM 10523]|uniref:Periplasmic component of the Tol biopolymer transport system n=1 Tax=Desulfocapsa sulfexigens (strain DSM 10523 / SB164P1) TaxID=1167006 RepID=M1P5Q5_DESSD|nr:periplasmic component of the Tol biopolymer transport system [Desulfocapsa sulfexigens DSM 10523]